MSDPHVFPDPSITVTWSKRRCTHAAECVRNLPQVFEPGRKPWVTPGEAPADAIARVIARCPTGALQFERHDGGAAEVPDAEATVRPTRHGPLVLRGNLRVNTPEGERMETRVSLCRCGNSRNAPFCDGAHREAGFRDAGEVFEGKLGAPAAAGPVRVIARENGPLRLLGNFTLASDDGRVKLAGGEVALCRCGQSRNKPFCDGTHRSTTFRAPALGLPPVAPA